ncbi:hypothetical protein D3C78_1529030 [compost metagenome]
MYTNQLCVGHIPTHISMDFFKHVLYDGFRHGHCCCQHGSCSMTAVQLRNCVKTFLTWHGEILEHSSMNMDIDEPRQ